MVGEEGSAQQLQDPDCVVPHLGCSWQQARQNAGVGLMREVVVQQEEHILHTVGSGIPAAVGGIQLAILLEEHLQNQRKYLQHATVNIQPASLNKPSSR